jgi:hypothetical protein
MFFNIHIDPQPQDKASAKTEEKSSEKNRDGEPMYLTGREGELIINDPTLLVSKEYSTSPPDVEALDRTSVLTNIGWVPCSKVAAYCQ